MIRKLKSGEYRLYSRKVDPKTRKRRNLGTFKSRAAAQEHEREVQYFKRHQPDHREVAEQTRKLRLRVCRSLGDFCVPSNFV
jgi:hypothetical protein